MRASTQIRQCQGKVEYPTLQAARRAARALGRAEGDWLLSAYHCRACGAFHIGHRFESGRSCRLANGAIGRKRKVRRRGRRMR